jgi:hypothetical protein
MSLKKVKPSDLGLLQKSISKDKKNNARLINFRNHEKEEKEK